MNATFLTAVAVIVLAVWALIDSLENLSKTADVVLTAVAGVLALVAAVLSMPRTARP